MQKGLTPDICYIAGLSSKNRESRKNAIGVQTSVPEIEQKFVEIAVKVLEIDPKKIFIEHSDGRIHAYFYHSRVAKRLANISSRESHIFKKPDQLSAAYLAGIFDAAGHIRSGSLSINPISPQDALMLQNLGIHTRGNTVLNISSLFSMIKGRSIMADMLEKRHSS